MGKILGWFVNHKKMAAGILCTVVIVALVLSLGAPVDSVLSVMGRAKEQPVCRVSREDRVLALTFNITEDVELEAMLLLLAKEELKATFFVSGRWMEENPEDVQRINEMGHEYGLLGYTGQSMQGMDEDDVQDEAEKCAELLQESTGKRAKLFRVPEGEYDDELLASIRPDYEAIHHNVNVYDYAGDSIGDIVKKTMDRLRSGGIILCDNNMSKLGLYLPIVAEKARDEGYEFLFLSEMLIEGGYTDMQGIQRK